MRKFEDAFVLTLKVICNSLPKKNLMLVTRLPYEPHDNEVADAWQLTVDGFSSRRLSSVSFRPLWTIVCEMRPILYVPIFKCKSFVFNSNRTAGIFCEKYCQPACYKRSQNMKFRLWTLDQTIAFFPNRYS